MNSFELFSQLEKYMIVLWCGFAVM